MSSHDDRLNATDAQEFPTLMGPVALAPTAHPAMAGRRSPRPVTGVGPGSVTGVGLGIVQLGRETHDVDKLDRTTLRPKNAESAPVQGYRLLVIGEHQHTAHRLPQGGAVSLGRSDAADIQVQDPLMSRVHAKVHMSPSLSVTDLGSSNGTIVRGERVPANTPTSISVGDTIEVGSTVVIVQPDFSRAQRLVADGTGDADPQRKEAPEESPMDRVHKLARRIAGSQINVLLLGETGVGKEVMARKIHGHSPRANQPFLGLNCASLNEQLFESELFGYEKGAFTGANAPKTGLIESADGGTVFLDEVGEMPLSTQAKLLRVLQERQVMRVGGLRPRDIDVRFVAATNQHLEKEIDLGNFREDLFYRLNGISLVIPPLRERRTEIPSLAQIFITQACTEAGYDEEPVLSNESIAWMQAHEWPGNIRELRNATTRAVLLASDGIIQPEHLRTEAYAPRSSRGPGHGRPTPRDGNSAVAGLPAAPAAPMGTAPSAVSLTPAHLEERQRVLDALAACGGNQTRAAKLLGIARRTLTTKLDKLGIPRPRKDRKRDA